MQKLYTLLLLILPVVCLAQTRPNYDYWERYAHPQKKNWSVDIGFGFNALSGTHCAFDEPAKQRLFINPHLSAGVGYQFTHYTSFFFRASYVNLYCKDALTGNNNNAVASHNMAGELGIKQYLHPMRDYDEYLRRFNYYALTGAGLLYVNPISKQTGQLLAEAKGNQLALVVPLGLGVDYRLSNFFIMGVEAKYHFTSTDMLDGPMQEGANSSKQNDQYASFGVRLTYRIPRSDFEYDEFLKLKNKPNAPED